MPLISIVSPVYKAEKIIPTLVQRIITSLTQITDDFEVLLVDDCGPDNSWAEIVKASKYDSRVKGIKLSRNFGQHAAITAGLSEVEGDWIVVMDCDLQDQPEEIPFLYQEAINTKRDVVLARRVQRIDGFFKRLSSKAFYQTLGYLTNTEQNPEVANFGIYKSKVIDAVLAMKDYVRFFPTMVKWVGFEVGTLEVQHAERFEGDSSYNFASLFRLGIDTVLSFSDKPLRLMIRLGGVMSIASFCFAMYYICAHVLGIITVSGFSSIMVSIWFLGGVIITLMGMLGLYLGKAFDQVKDRPVYIISEISKQHETVRLG